MRVLAAVRRWGRGLHWYLREVSGEADYDHYLAHRLAHRHGQAAEALGEKALSRAEFERRRWDRAATTPGARCC